MRRANVDRWLFWQVAHLSPLIGRIAGERVFKPLFGGIPDEAIIEAAQKELDRFLPVLDAPLSERQFIATEYSVADIALAPWVAQCAQSEIDLTSYTGICAWLDRMTSRDSWLATEPESNLAA